MEYRATTDKLTIVSPNKLFADNILDLTHADFLHACSLGSGALTRTRAKVTESDDCLTIQWHFKNEMPSPTGR